ncbi:ABC transporter ATP-binding protein [Mucilaginibacter koreensis]
MLKVENLDIRFLSAEGNYHAVKNISFQVKKGETLGIVGESGSGKSVTSLAVMRLHNPATTQITGHIYLNDQDLLGLSEKQMQSIRGNRIAMIFQEPMTSLNPVLTCGYQVQEALLTHQSISKKAARQAVVDLFNEVQLPRPELMYKSYPNQLSGGQKQRVMIAMALACNPELLIADEPTTALDVTVQKTIIELLLKLKAERNMSLIFISHDIGVISEVADRVMVMYKGECIEENEVEELLTHPQHPYTKGLLACRPSPAIRLKKLPVVADFYQTDNSATTDVQQVLQQHLYPENEIYERRSKLYQAPPLLRVSNLCTWYPVKQGLFGKAKDYIKAVNEVSFDVYPGETLGLVGESGSGKSTLGRSILRLMEPTSGQIQYKGTDLLKLKSNELRKMRRNMQLIFQDPYSSLNPRITVGRAIMEALQVHRLYDNDTQRKQKVLDMLQRVNLLPEHFNRYPHEFSGGQRQRIVIARALILQPEFLVCDESVSALDVSVQAQVLNLLKELQAEFQLTYIFISHDLSVIKHISDRVIVLNKGQIEESGYPDDIYYHPQKAYTQKLIASIPGYTI